MKRLWNHQAADWLRRSRSTIAAPSKGASDFRPSFEPCTLRKKVKQRQDLRIAALLRTKVQLPKRVQQRKILYQVENGRRHGQGGRLQQRCQKLKRCPLQSIWYSLHAGEKPCVQADLIEISSSLDPDRSLVVPTKTIHRRVAELIEIDLVDVNACCPRWLPSRLFTTRGCPLMIVISSRKMRQPLPHDHNHEHMQR